FCWEPLCQVRSNLCDGASVSQKAVPMVRKEGETVTFECTYSTSYSSYNLYWFRRYPGKQPEFIKSKSFTSLSISELVVSDSAVYDCAFIHTTVINCTASLVQKLRIYIIETSFAVSLWRHDSAHLFPQSIRHSLARVKIW
uniref:Ig-like domain-containing protein n=1 Tax=Callorhinchus milii TaxID=7868 RepID=A0A4W3HCT1_CALMI